MSSMKCWHYIKISKRFNPNPVLRTLLPSHIQGLPVLTILIYKVTVGIRELYTSECAGTVWFLYPDKSFFP